MKINKVRVLAFTLLGGISGFLILHPYSMLAYLVQSRHLTAFEEVPGIMEGLIFSFDPHMLYMGIPFALLGSAAGAFFGLWHETRRRREEAEKKAFALATLKQLMVTLSHYLLNASTVIGGYSSIMLKNADDPKTKEHLETIKAESECIEAVVKSLQSLKEVETEPYGQDSETMMIDIERQIRERLEKRRAEAKERAA